MATAALEVNQVIARFVSGAPLESFTVAVPRCVCPATSDADGSETETDATRAGLLTSMTEVPYDEQAATLMARPVTARMKERIVTRPPV